MVNKCELLKSVVTYDKPKVLIGLNQKVSEQVAERMFLRPQMSFHRRNGKTSTTQVFARNVVNPYRSRKGSDTARGREGDAGKGKWRKRRPSCNETDRD